MYFTGGYSLPNGIASEYLNCIEDPKYSRLPNEERNLNFNAAY
jgi:hypothetical protein